MLVKNLFRRMVSKCTDEKSESFSLPPPPQWVEVTGGPLKGYHMFLDLLSPASWQREMMEGRYDPFIYEALDKCESIEGATVWDVGAHIGYHSLAFAALVGPTGHVVAFEPNSSNVERFRKNLERNQSLAEQITLMTCALSNVDGEAPFVFSPEVNDGTSSGSHLNEAVVPEDQAAYQSFSQTTVSTVKADTLLREERVPAPSIVKIDVEGAEVLALEGSLEMLSAVRPTLFIEIHNVVTMFYTQKLLTELGYKIEIIDEEHSSTSRCFIMAKPVKG